MECIVCFEPGDIYTIGCGSSVPHNICNNCEQILRISSQATNGGRFIKCPLCRTQETVQGNRTEESYKAELALMYSGSQVLHKVVQIHVQHRRPRLWCQSGRRETGECPTKSKTDRLCPRGICNKHVCRECGQCTSH
jgi:hypothetical protein